ncbi:MAG TPA: hypothetical protein VGF99_17825, partial [Myxococcota bacterium]
MNWMLPLLLLLSGTPALSSTPTTTPTTSTTTTPSEEFVAAVTPGRWPTTGLVLLASTTSFVVGAGVTLGSLVVASLPMPYAGLISNGVIFLGVAAAPIAAGAAVGIASDTDTMLTTMAVGSGGGLIGFVAGALIVGGLSAMTAPPPPPTAPNPSVSSQVVNMALAGGALGWLLGGVV